MNNILNNLGICCRARGLISGEEFVIDGIRNGNVCLVFLASDASDNTRKRVNDKASFYHVDVVEDFDSAKLSQAIGKNNRKVIGITDRNFVKLLKK